MISIGVVVDNDFVSDVRVQKEVDILQKNGYLVHVLCFGFDDNQYAKPKDISISRIPIKKSKKNTLFFFFNRMPFYEKLWRREIKKFISNKKPDVLHVHDLYMSKSASEACSDFEHKIPVVLDLHENFPEAFASYNWTKGHLRGFLTRPKLWQKKEADYLSRASKIIVLSESYKKDLLNRYSFLKEELLVAFPNVIDLRKFETFKVDRSVKRSKKTTLMYFGIVGERRGVFDSILALKKGIENGLNIKLILIGPVDKMDKNRFDKVIKEGSIRESIEHIPWIQLSDLLTYMNISDILLSPIHKNKQHESGVANKVYQYMFGKKPLIVSDCKPQRELVEKFNCGLSYSSQEEFVSCITRLYENRELRERMGKNGFNKLYEHYDNELFENRLLNVYKDLF